MKDPMISAIRSLYDRIGTLDIDGACSLLVDDVDVVFPFAVGKTHVQGRDAVRSRLSAVVPKLFRSIRFAFSKFYFCPDENAWIAQFKSTGVRVKGPLPYENEYVAIRKFDGEKIAYRAEYHVKGAGGIDKLALRR